MNARSVVGRMFRRLASTLPSVISSRIPRRPFVLDRSRSALPARTLRSVQAATFRYRFNGVLFVKNPFDLALYMMLLSNERPRTIVEIGS